MFCKNCGANLADNALFCTSCGSATGVSAANAHQSYQQPQYQQPQYQQPQYQQPQYQQPQYQQPQYQQTPLAQELSMKWFKFLIYFSLFAGAVLNVGSAFMTFTGSHYLGYADEVYDMFEALQAIDILYGVVLLGLAAFGIFVRMRLAGYYANGPKLLNVLYIVSLAVGVVYSILVAIVVSDAIGSDALDFTSNASSIAVNIAMIAANTAYFKKRAHLFTR